MFESDVIREVRRYIFESFALVSILLLVDCAFQRFTRFPLFFNNDTKFNLRAKSAKRECDKLESLTGPSGVSSVIPSLSPRSVRRNLITTRVVYTILLFYPQEESFKWSPIKLSI